MRIPWPCKFILAIAGFVIFFPGMALLILHQFFSRVPESVSFTGKLLVSAVGLAIALVGGIPVLIIESRRGD